MKLILLQKYYFMDKKEKDKFQGWEFIMLKAKHFQFRWFTDCGEWFIYIHFGNRWIRFSSAGFMKW